MTTYKVLPVLLVVGLFWVAFSSSEARADTWNKKTTVTFNEPVALPGEVVLQPGDYVMKLADSQSSRHIVQVFNADQDHVYATILAIPKYRSTPADKTVITFYERPVGEPQYLRAWFYPGDNFGQEFAYPKEKAVYLARNSGTNVPIAPSDEEREIAPAVTPEEGQAAVSTAAAAESPSETAPAQTESATVEEPPSSEGTQLAQARPPAQNQYETDGQVTHANEVKELPQTASDLPLLGLTGLLSLGAALGVRLLAIGRSRS